jgi:hypothetical protein
LNRIFIGSHSLPSPSLVRHFGPSSCPCRYQRWAKTFDLTRDDIKIAVEKRSYHVRILQKRSSAIQENLSMADAYDHMVNGNRGDACMDMDLDGGKIPCTCGIVD